MNTNEIMDSMRKIIVEKNLTNIPSDIVLSFLDIISMLDETIQIKDGTIQIKDKTIQIKDETIQIKDEMIDILMHEGTEPIAQSPKMIMVLDDQWKDLVQMIYACGGKGQPQVDKIHDIINNVEKNNV